MSRFADPQGGTFTASYYRAASILRMNRFMRMQLSMIAILGGCLAIDVALADPPVSSKAPLSDSNAPLSDSSETAASGTAAPSQAVTAEEKIEKKKPAPAQASAWKPLEQNWKTCRFGGEGEVVLTETKPKEGQTFTSKKLITLEFGDPLTGVYWDGEFPTQNFEVALQARRTDGFDFFLGLTFPIDQAAVTLVLGGWGGGITGISSIDDRDASENETTMFQRYEDNQWYTVRARVDPFGITCWVDDDKVVEVDRGDHKFGTRVEMDLCEPLGLAAFQSVSEYRDVRVSQANGPGNCCGSGQKTRMGKGRMIERNDESANEGPRIPMIEFDRHWMQRALEMAMEAERSEEVPVGAIIVREGDVIAAARNERETLKDPTAHAEMIAITQAAASIEDWRLEQCTLYVTLGTLLDVRGGDPAIADPPSGIWGTRS